MGLDFELLAQLLLCPDGASRLRELQPCLEAAQAEAALDLVLASMLACNRAGQARPPGPLSRPPRRALSSLRAERCTHGARAAACPDCAPAPHPYA